jgi:glucose/arabinose dehydrogenase
VSVGDAWRPPLAADTDALVGKILRFERDGSIPADNPTPGSPVWARGLRNTQAFDWLPDGSLLGVEHGPSGADTESGRMGQDELNVIQPGADYGWPRVAGWAGSEGSTPPIWVWRNAIAPGGLSVVQASATTDSVAVMVAGLRFKLLLLSLVRGAEGWSVRDGVSLISGDYGRLRGVVQAPDGSFWVTTSNRDARGQAGPLDDLILRVELDF